MTRSHIRPAMLASWLTASTLFAAPASAALIFWTGGDTGTWNNIGNWDNGVPGGDDYTFFHGDFANANDVVVSFTGNIDNLGLSFTHLDVTFDMNGHTYQAEEFISVFNSAFVVNNGTLIAATATVDSGSVMTIASDAAVNIGSTIVGGAAASTAQIDVAGGQWTSEVSLILGNSGNGTLNVGHDGANSTGDGGEVNVGMLLLGAAGGGQGEINLGDGAVLRSETATLASGNGSSGTVNIGDGAQWINSGAIIAGALGATGGTGAINIDDNGLLRAGTISIGNNGSITQVGTGAIVMADVELNLNSLPQTVQDRINAGGLFVAADGLAILNGGVVEATAGYIDSFNAGTRASATISGGNSLLDLGAGDFVIGGFQNGFLTITGGARADSGDGVIGEASSGSGTVSISGRDGATASQWNIDGSLAVGEAGSGELSITAGGLLTTTGDAAVGATQSGSGTVIVSGNAGSAASASLMDVGGNMAVGVDLGQGAAASLNSVNATLTVTNDGIVRIGGGVGTLTINESGQLTGNSIIDGSVQLFGRLSPGLPTGALTVTGDLQSHDGSVIQIQYSNEALDLAAVFPNLNPALVNDLLTSGFVAVEGQATLADGTVINVVKLTGGATPGDSFIIVHSEQGGMNPMSPPDLDIQGAFLVQWVTDLIDDGGEQYLLLTAELDEPGLEDFLAGLSGNIGNVANALADGELFDVLTQLDPNNAEAGLRTLLPLQHSAAAVQNIRASQHFSSALLQEMAGRRSGLRGDRLSGNNTQRMFSSAGMTSISNVGEPIALGAMEDYNGTWDGFIGGMGLWDRVDSGDDRVGQRIDVAGVHAGVHYHLSRDLLVGLSAGYLWSDLEFRRGFGEGEIDTIRIGPYLSWSPGGSNFFIDAAASYGYHRNDMDRMTMMGTARSSYDAYDISALGQAGYDFELGERTVLTPVLGVEFVQLRSESFTERGAGSANLDVDALTSDSLRLRLGASIAHAFDLGRGTTIVPELYAGWAHELMDTDVDLRSRFVAGGPDFRTRAAGVGRDAVQVSAGFTAVAGTYITLFVRYEGEFQSDRTSHGVVGGLNFRF